MSVQTYRRPVQAIFLIISIILLGGIARYCPFVGVQQIAGALGYDLIDEAFDAGTIRGFSRLTILVGGFTLFVIVFGRVWCGWICPFGSIMSAANSLKLPVRERSPP
ncbi:MAG: 4Fe-4S binding protein, partial [Methanopyri archaeon]|nr:4Fe-4S binding protein [Methanopyri archaeon]